MKRWFALGGYTALLYASAPPWPDDWDGVGFVESVRDFDLARFHPHPPGYPVYVALLRAAAVVARDPMRACALVAALSGAAAVAFAWLAARRLAGERAAWAVAVLVGVTPLVFHAFSGVGSEGPALAFAAACAWACIARPARAPLLLGLAVGLGLGVRLSWAPIYLAALVLAPRAMRLRAVAVAALACVAWAVPLVAVVGTHRIVFFPVRHVPPSRGTRSGAGRHHGHRAVRTVRSRAGSRRRRLRRRAGAGPGSSRGRHRRAARRCAGDGVPRLAKGRMARDCEGARPDDRRARTSSGSMRRAEPPRSAAPRASARRAVRGGSRVASAAKGSRARALLGIVSALTLLVAVRTGARRLVPTRGSSPCASSWSRSRRAQPSPDAHRLSSAHRASASSRRRSWRRNAFVAGNCLRRRGAGTPRVDRVVAPLARLADECARWAALPAGDGPSGRLATLARPARLVGRAPCLERLRVEAVLLTEGTVPGVYAASAVFPSRRVEADPARRGRCRRWRRTRC